jgi:hypothetical protein
MVLKPTPWHAVKPLSLVMSPAGRVTLVADIRMDEGDRFEVLLVNSSHEWRQMSFDAFDSAVVISDQLAALFNLLIQFPEMERIG